MYTCLEPYNETSPTTKTCYKVSIAATVQPMNSDWQPITIVQPINSHWQPITIVQPMNSRWQPILIATGSP